MGPRANSMETEPATSASTGLAAGSRRGAALPAWKQEVNDRVAAARARRQQVQEPLGMQGRSDGASPKELPERSNSRASRVAAAVAARYAHAPSYSEYLATEVREAIDAAMMARAAVDRPEADAGGQAGPGGLRADHGRHLPAPRTEAATAHESVALSGSTLQAVRTDGASSGFVDRTPAAELPGVGSAHAAMPRKSMPQSERMEDGHVDLAASDPVERAAQQSAPVIDPVAEAFVAPATPLPAKLIEFPRELVAARKARPRHAEGPLRESSADAVENLPGQLRIFEVQPSETSTGLRTPNDMRQGETQAAGPGPGDRLRVGSNLTAGTGHPGTEPPPMATEWSSIQLDAFQPDTCEENGPAGNAAFSGGATTCVTPGNRTAAYNRDMADAFSHSVHLASRMPGRSTPASLHGWSESSPEEFVHVAALSDRLMAGLVDAALVGIAFALFVLVVAASTPHPPTGRPALVGAALVFCLFYLMYQFLFFTFAESTPGMRYAHIALCTFDDRNPSREAMRKRIFALVLAAAPVGIGFLYALFDEDSLGWHDRMTRMYQRSYK